MNRSNMILWIDDNTSFMKLIFESMKDNGDELLYTENILFAENTSDALKLYTEYHPALVFLDILMPEPDGLECARLIREIDPGAQISFVSNYSNDERAINAIKSHLVNSKIDKGIGIGALSAITAFIIKTLIKVV